MGSISQQIKLPFIDFNKLKGGGDKPSPECPEWAVLRAQVRRALEEFGCFEAHFDRLPIELRDGVLGLLPELFDLPLEMKMRNISRKLFHGYMGPLPNMPLYESIGIDNPDINEKVEEVLSPLWPQGHPSFSKIVESYSKRLVNLDRIIRRMILESLGVENYLDEHYDSADYILRVVKYNGSQTPEKQVGLPPHADKNFITILYHNHVEGLEIQTKDGEWIRFKPSPESFVILTGQALYAWVNGRFRSPVHRVMIRGSETRYTVGLFSIPKEDYLIKAPNELIDEEHPLLFRPYYHYDFLHFYSTEGEGKDNLPLKAYCGM